MPLLNNDVNDVDDHKNNNNIVLIEVGIKEILITFNGFFTDFNGCFNTT